MPAEIESVMLEKAMKHVLKIVVLPAEIESVMLERVMKHVLKIVNENENLSLHVHLNQ
jgi:hypothetical protein